MVTYSDQTPRQFAGVLPEATDVLIIGGGVIGISTAYHLAKKGVKVVVCEKGRVAGEQSSRNWGWIRQQGRDHAELPITMESNRIWQQLVTETNEDLGFTQQGVYYLAESEKDLASYEAFMKLAKEHGLDTQILTEKQVLEQIQGRPGRWRGGMVTPSDARAEPWQAVPAIARIAERLGVTIVEDCAVRTLDFEGGQLTGAVTEQGRIKAGRVLLAGGAWSALFADNMGVKMPQLAVRATVAATAPVENVFNGNAADSNFAFRRRVDGGYSLALSDLHNHFIGPSSFKHLFKWLPSYKVSFKGVSLGLKGPKGHPDSWGHKRSWTGNDVTPFENVRVMNPQPAPSAKATMLARLADRFPQLAGTRLVEIWAGMIDAMPDFIPIMDEAPDHKGLFIATGFSGHGFGIGPAAGRIMSDLMEGNPAGHDMTRFRFNRFHDGSKIELGPFL
ncbi:FAD-binding oxidoreductase [Pseudovibrio exalbescens]|uniref:NAD(P)/FAD-dependent oxidoreductase n=1 Tax=Pseudovibrio exalbescens TaxID=197461 RepID=UPI0023668BF4|nr:FAD-binding oxidoreductase [Pseudovibrio exalbescens]MDD7909101.1 FAD-binding oxidoreductase [Pseudovibrio exalbescens]